MGRIRLLIPALLCGAIALGTGVSTGAGQAPAAQAWSGTVTVTRKAAGTMRSDDGKASLGFDASETITFMLSPDGVASYQGTHHNSWDIGGQYAIPTVGSGSGTTYYGVGFNGVSWEVVIEGGDNIPTETNHTAEDLWWANQFRELAKLAEAAGGGKPAPYNGRIEKGGRSVSGVAFVAKGTATAKSLSGSHTEKRISSGPENIDGLPTIPMTETITWNLTLGPVQPKVSIRGPDCGCLDAVDPVSTPLTFRAGTTVPGGEFSEFEVIPEGKAPDIVSNVGGERPELVLTGTKETGAVTLKIHYTKNGKRYAAPPRRVEFCTLEDIHLMDDEHDLAFSDESLVVEAKTKAWHNGDEVGKDVRWDLEKMGSPTSLSSDPADAKAEKVTFTYEGLPESNDSFGPRKLTASVSRGQCACHAREEVRTFFVGDDHTHPGDDTPNWFYYWKQTEAAPRETRAALRYRQTLTDPHLPSARPIARYDPETQTLLVSQGVYVQDGCRGEVDRATHAPTGRRDQGIDCFGQIVRHEWQHRQDAVTWWGTPAGPFGISLAAWFAKDWDHDQVPNDVEDRETGCQYGSWPAVTPEGGRETWFTCASRPFADATDAEINAYWVGWTWPTGSVDTVDWSCGPRGKQWRGASCGR